MNVASSRASQTVEGGVLLVLPTRVCLDVQVDNMRRLRGGRRGLVRTRAVETELRRALSTSSSAAARSSVGHCDETLDPENPSVALDWVRASPNLMPMIRRERANRTVLTEISTRLVCNPSEGDDVEDACFEDEVSVSVLVLDQDGKPIHVAGLSIPDEDRAASAVSNLLATFAHESPGSNGAGVLSGQGAACRLTAGDILDCT